MSVRAFSRITCPHHGETLAQWDQCVLCGAVIPTQVEDNTTRAVRARKRRSRDAARMRAARAAKRAQQVTL